MVMCCIHMFLLQLEVNFTTIAHVGCYPRAIFSMQPESNTAAGGVVDGVSLSCVDSGVP